MAAENPYTSEWYAIQVLGGDASKVAKMKRYAHLHLTIAQYISGSILLSTVNITLIPFSPAF